MFFFDYEMDNDPVQKQMQIIGMYDMLLKRKSFLKKLKKELFYRKDKEHEHWGRRGWKYFTYTKRNRF